VVKSYINYVDWKFCVNTVADIKLASYGSFVVNAASVMLANLMWLFSLASVWYGCFHWLALNIHVLIG